MQNEGKQYVNETIVYFTKKLNIFHWAQNFQHTEKTHTLFYNLSSSICCWQVAAAAPPVVVLVAAGSGRGFEKS